MGEIENNATARVAQSMPIVATTGIHLSHQSSAHYCLRSCSDNEIRIFFFPISHSCWLNTPQFSYLTQKDLKLETVETNLHTATAAFQKCYEEHVWWKEKLFIPGQY